MLPNYGLNFATATAADASEKAIVTNNTDENHMPGTGGFVVVSGQINVTPGTSTTAVVVKVRQGSGTSGTTVKSMTHTLAAAATGNIAFRCVDESPAAGGQYTVTLTQTAGAGAGTVHDALVVAEPYPQG